VVADEYGGQRRQAPRPPFLGKNDPQRARLAWRSEYGGLVIVNRDGFERLIRELDHLLHNRPVMGTLLMSVQRTPHILVASQQDGVIRLSYAHTGWLDFLRVRRFKSFCRARGFPLRTQVWWKSRVTSAAIGSVAPDAAQAIDECFANVYGLAGPFGIDLQGGLAVRRVVGLRRDGGHGAYAP
jgi:hypothetical protein